MVDIIAEDIDVVASSGIVVETAEEVVIDGVERDIEVTFDSNEFSIVGDDMVVLTRYEDAPQWMKDVINNLIDVKASLVVGDLEATREALDAMLTQLDVAKNAYELSIVSSNDIDQRITTAITSLNSSLQAADATILDIAQTAVTPNEASAIALNTLSASLSANGAIGSALHNLQTAMTTLEGTTASDISFLESVMQGEVEGNATALSELRTHVGIDEDGGLTGTGLLSDVKVLQKQNDGVIETSTGTWDVMIGIENPNNNTDDDQLDTAQEPYATWKSIDTLNGNSHERYSHLGDVYIKYTNATEGYKTYDKAYKFIKVVPDSTSPYSTDTEGFTWALITDTDAQNAYVAALNALDLADSKRRVFVDTPTVPYDIGDLWIKTVSGGNQLYKSESNRTDSYNSGDWTIADDAQVNNFVSTVYEPGMLDLQGQVDKQVNYYFYTSSSGQTPTSISGSTGWDATAKKEHHGDIAYDRTTNIGHYYDKATSSWVEITGSENAGVIESLKAASIAQATADGKVSHMYGVYQNSTPTVDGTYKYWLTTTKVLKVLESTSWVDFAASKIDVGDIITVWDSALKDEFKYYWNGSSWYTQQENGIVASSQSITDLNIDLTALGTTVGGHTTLINNVSGDISVEGARVESKFAYGSSLTIDGATYNSGFGMTNSAGTGFGSEFWVDASRFKFTNSAKTGSKAPFTIQTDGATPEITFNGKVNFSNVNGANMSGSNLLYNSAPTIGIETKGWQVDYNSTGIASSGLLATGDPYRPTGGGAFHQHIPGGTPAVDTVFDIRSIGAIPVIGGQFYEGSAYLNSHRCDSRIYVGWRDSAGATIAYSVGDIVTQTNTTNVLATWGRSKFIAQAPANAVSCYYYIRGISIGEGNPYVFTSMCYFGRASEGQSVFSNWSDGISAGATNISELTNDAGFVLPSGVANAINTNTTTIDGSKITTGTVAAAQIYSDSALINKLNVTGGLIANNLRVPGVNGGSDLLSASGDKVVISNLKVLGTVSMPGISKGGSFSVPSLGVESSYSVVVNKPYVCSNWSVTAIVSLTNLTGNRDTTDFGCRLYINGTQVSAAQGVSNWAINVSTTGTLGTISAESATILIDTSGFGASSGSIYGSISYITIVEN